MDTEESTTSRGSMLGQSLIPRGKVTGFIAKQRLAFATRRLEHEMVEIVNLVEGHKAVDLPPGHVYYQLLLKRAKHAISQYQTAVGQLGFPMPTYHDVAMGMPALKEIEDLASAAGGQGMVKQVATALPLVAVVLGLSGTFVFTVCQVMHYYLIHWLGVR